MQLNNVDGNLTDSELVQQQRDMAWEETRQQVINQTQAAVYGQLRTTQVTLAIGVANDDFSTTFRNDVKRLLLQMAATIEVQDVSGA